MEGEREREGKRGRGRVGREGERVGREGEKEGNIKGEHVQNQG